MKTPESDKRNQQRCDKCGRIVGCDYRGRLRKCDCNQGEQIKEEIKTTIFDLIDQLTDHDDYTIADRAEIIEYLKR